MSMKVFTFILILLMQGCSTMDNIVCAPVVKLKAIESEELNNIVLSNDFISGCVTELISDFRELSTTDYLNQCKTDFTDTLSYVQWLEIYNSCRIK